MLVAPLRGKATLLFSSVLLGELSAVSVELGVYEKTGGSFQPRSGFPTLHKTWQEYMLSYKTIEFKVQKHIQTNEPTVYFEVLGGKLQNLIYCKYPKQFCNIQ